MSIVNTVYKKCKKVLKLKIPKTHKGLVKRASILSIRLTKNNKNLGKRKKRTDDELIKSIERIKFNKDMLLKFFQKTLLKYMSKYKSYSMKQKLAISYQLSKKIYKQYRNETT